MFQLNAMHWQSYISKLELEHLYPSPWQTPAEPRIYQRFN